MGWALDSSINVLLYCIHYTNGLRYLPHIIWNYLVITDTQHSETSPQSTKATEIIVFSLARFFYKTTSPVMETITYYWTCTITQTAPLMFLVAVENGDFQRHYSSPLNLFLSCVWFKDCLGEGRNSLALIYNVTPKCE